VIIDIFLSLSHHGKQLDGKQSFLVTLKQELKNLAKQQYGKQRMKL
jgi:hypothetical protein